MKRKTPRIPQYSHLKPYYDLPFKPFRHKSVKYFYWRDFISEIATYLLTATKWAKNKAPNKLKQLRHLKFKLRWEHILIAFLIGLLLATHAQGRVLPDTTALGPGISIKTYKLQKPLEMPSKLAEQPNISTIYVPPPAVPVTDCGSDPQMAYIFTVESGCRTNSVNPGGCFGLGQDCNGWMVNGHPGAPQCPNWQTDWNCQYQYWTWYANAVYGSIYNAYLFRQSHNYW